MARISWGRVCSSWSEIPGLCLKPIGHAATEWALKRLWDELCILFFPMALEPQLVIQASSALVINSNLDALLLRSSFFVTFSSYIACIFSYCY